MTAGADRRKAVNAQKGTPLRAFPFVFSRPAAPESGLRTRFHSQVLRRTDTEITRRCVLTPRIISRCFACFRRRPSHQADIDPHSSPSKNRIRFCTGTIRSLPLPVENAPCPARRAAAKQPLRADTRGEGRSPFQEQHSAGVRLFLGRIPKIVPNKRCDSNRIKKQDSRFHFRIRKGFPIDFQGRARPALESLATKTAVLRVCRPAFNLAFPAPAPRKRRAKISPARQSSPARHPSAPEAGKWSAGA